MTDMGRDLNVLLEQLVRNRLRDLPADRSPAHIRAFQEQLKLSLEAIQTWLGAVGRHLDQNLSGLSESAESCAYGHMTDLQSDMAGLIEQGLQNAKRAA